MSARVSILMVKNSRSFELAESGTIRISPTGGCSRPQRTFRLSSRLCAIGKTRKSAALSILRRRPRRPNQPLSNKGRRLTSPPRHPDAGSACASRRNEH